VARIRLDFLFLDDLNRQTIEIFLSGLKRNFFFSLQEGLLSIRGSEMKQLNLQKIKYLHFYSFLFPVSLFCLLEIRIRSIETKHFSFIFNGSQKEARTNIARTENYKKMYDNFQKNLQFMKNI
jgi:hypothetical protein